MTDGTKTQPKPLWARALARRKSLLVETLAAMLLGFWMPVKTEAVEEKPKPPRGFAAMTPDQRRVFASRGGTARQKLTTSTVKFQTGDPKVRELAKKGVEVRLRNLALREPKPEPEPTYETDAVDPEATDAVLEGRGEIPDDAA